jgi:hypothetical protein
LLDSRPVAVDTQTSPAAPSTTAPTPSQILTPLRRGRMVPTFSDDSSATTTCARTRAVVHKV